MIEGAPSRGGKAWTTAERQRARTLRQTMSAAEVAREMGRSTAAIRQVTRKTRAWSPQDDREVAALQTMAEWGRAHGRSRNAVYSRRRRLRREGWMDADH